MSAKVVWVIEAPPESYGIGTAFDSEEAARDEAEAWGGFDVLGPFVEVAKPGALGDAVRSAVNIMRAIPGGLYMTTVKLDDGRWAELRILPDKPKRQRTTSATNEKGATEK